MSLHLSDRDLLQGLDGELPASRRVVVERHVRECETCRRRQAAIEQTAIAASSVFRVAVRDDLMTEAARERLRDRLSDAARETAARPWKVGIAGRATASRRGLAWGGAAAAAAMVAWLSFALLPAGFGILPAAHAGAPLPVSSITPGATWDVSAADLCTGTRHTRTITAAMRAQVLSAYGMERVPANEYELDYLITPELGGATDARNLWPQAYASPVWNAGVKDELERLLPRLVCGGALALETAQRDMAVDWIAAYKKYFNTDQPLRAHRGPAYDPDDEEVYTLTDMRPAPAVRLVSLR